MAKKEDVVFWLSERDFVFVEMNDAEKWEMRQALNMCGAATSTSNYTFPCIRPPMKNGSERCFKHGGKSPRGIAHYNYGTGKDSRYAPARWLEAMQRAAQDTTLMDLQRDLVVIEGAIDETLRRLDQGISTDDRITKLIGSARALMGALKQQDDVAAARLLNDVEGLLDVETGDAAIQGELREWIELRKQLIGEESKVRHRLRATISVEEAGRQFNALAMVVKSNVRKARERGLLTREQMNDLLEDIAEDFIRVVGFSTLPEPPADEAN